MGAPSFLEIIASPASGTSRILIGTGLLDQAAGFVTPLLYRKFVPVLADANLAELWLPVLLSSLRKAGIRAPVLSLPPGEGTKSLAMLGKILDWLIEQGIQRRDPVIALGGGVTGDIAGLAASVVLRGVPLIQIPTTLLAQVDSAVGGKTGINLTAGKNLAGSFHQPSLVLADSDTLRTLPPRERRAGHAEILKYGAIRDEPFLSWLEENTRAVLDCEPRALRHAVGTSCRIKAAIVSADEREAGDRALLNLGHTFGHALEAATGFSARLLHGEAVAIGMSLAADLSVQEGLCPGGDRDRLGHLLAGAGLPASLAKLRAQHPECDLSAATLVEYMSSDKKNLGQEHRLILLRRLGEAMPWPCSSSRIRRFLEAET